MTHLVDTSALTILGHPAVRSAIERRLQAGELARVGISDLECFGAHAIGPRPRLLSLL